MGMTRGLYNQLAVILLFAAVAHARDVTGPVADLIERHCIECHSAEEHKGGLSLASLDDILTGGKSGSPAIVPGHPEQSRILQHLRGQREPRMPHEKSPLSPNEIDTFERWVRTITLPQNQADVGRWWSYRPLAPAAPPATRHESMAGHPIDRFIGARLEAAGLDTAPPASRLELLRRAYFDLIGMPPTPQEADRFLRDERPEAWEFLIDRLLADPRYGERWGRHWLDLARFAETQGFEVDQENYNAWRYRDYVIRSFNADKPYDRFIREQLAGDEADPLNPEAHIATGFLRIAPQFDTTLALEKRQKLLNEATTIVGQVFLAQTLGCAQCHDHKYDPIPQRDFYRLQAFFVPMEFATADIPFDDAAMKAKTEEVTRRTDADLAAAKAELQALEKSMIDRLAEASSKPDKPAEKYTQFQLRIRFGFIPESKETFFTLVERRRHSELVRLVEPSGNALARLPGFYDRIKLRYEPKALTVHNVQETGLRPVFSFAFVRVRGEYNQLGDRVEPGFPIAVEGVERNADLATDRFGNLTGSRRILADWIGSGKNPLTARVMVNRIWQHHFGRGIVATPSDFGRQGARPTHPELLDWLADRFVQSGWSIKAMHRLMMTSATYQQSSRVEGRKAAKVDPANRLRWRFDRRRLEGEAIRDSILAVAGMCDRTMQGPSVFPPVPAGVEITNEGSEVWEPQDGPASWRRSIYVFQRRQLEFPFLSVLDAPVLSQSQPVRPVSTTPLQALSMFNGQLVDQAAAHLASRATAHAASREIPAQVRAAWQLTLTRDPDPDELAAATAFFRDDPDYALTDLCRVLLNSNEFIHVD